MPEDNNTNQESSVNETAAAYLGTRPRAALQDVEKDAPPSRFVLSPDKYTCGVPDESKLTSDEMVAMVEESLAQIEAGMCSPADEVWERLRKKHGWKL
jgi:hypothetical protein